MQLNQYLGIPNHLKAQAENYKAFAFYILCSKQIQCNYEGDDFYKVRCSVLILL